jgi:hypothetical protein
VVPAASALMLMMMAPMATGATGAPCRVVNLEQGTHGRSLVRMVEQAKDGDRLHVRGTCRGHVNVDGDVLIRGKGEAPTLEGPGRWRTAVRVTRGASVTIRDLTIQHGRGIRNQGRLTLKDSIVRRSTYIGVLNEGRMAIMGSVVRNNSSLGGIYNNGTLHVTASRIARNSS